jgi:hypothetical protein
MTMNQRNTQFDPSHEVEIDWRGERSRRRIYPVQNSDFFGATGHHVEPQWMFDAYDVEKKAIRTFAKKDVHSWTPVTE